MRTWMKIAAAALTVTALGGGVALAAMPQAGGDWKAARSQGLIGEQPDGYLGIVGSPTPALRALVSDVNMQRKKVYTEQATTSTIEEFAFVAGCNQIARLPAGEFYRTPDGRWVKKDSSAPVRDPRCV